MAQLAFTFDAVIETTVISTSGTTHQKRNGNIEQDITLDTIEDAVVATIKHVDWGEKIGGARKDIYTKKLTSEKLRSGDLNILEIEKVAKRNAAWDNEDMQALRESDANPFIVAYFEEIRKAMPASLPKLPSEASKTEELQVELAEKYIDMVNIVKDCAFDCYWLDTLQEAQEKLREVLGGTVFKEVISSEKNIRAYKLREEYILLKDVFKGSKKTGTSKLFDLMMTPSIFNADALFNVTWDALLSPDKKPGTERKKGIKKLIEEVQYLSEATRIGIDHRDGKDIDTETFAKTFGLRAIEFGNWVSQKERQSVLNHAFDALYDLAFAIRIEPKSIGLDGTLAMAFGSRGRGGNAKAHYEQARKVINLTKTTGAGSLAHEWFHALDNFVVLRSLEKEVSSELATERFENIKSLGSRDGLSGRPRHQMAHLFGSLGLIMKYNDAAKFFASQSESVLWEKSKELNRYRSKQARSKKRYKAEMYASLASGTYDTIGGETNFYIGSKNADTKAKKYWGTTLEMAARSFETVIDRKLSRFNMQSDYLAARGKYDNFLYEQILKGKTSYSIYPDGTTLDMVETHIDLMIESAKNAKLLTHKKDWQVPENTKRLDYGDMDVAMCMCDATAYNGEVFDMLLVRENTGQDTADQETKYHVAMKSTKSGKTGILKTEGSPIRGGLMSMVTNIYSALADKTAEGQKSDISENISTSRGRGR